MFDVSQALAILQFGDSAYPAGGFAFSWGIEGLLADGFVLSHADLDAAVAEHLRWRWATMDRVLLVRAFDAEELDLLADVDRLCEAMTMSAQMREGSRRAGTALLGVADKLGAARAAVYRQQMPEDRRLGHLAVVQGLVFRDLGFHRDAAELLSGWTLVTGLVSAATRLGIIGHIEAQRSLAAARLHLAEVLAVQVPAYAEPSSFTPVIDIAISRGPARDVRMFAT
ncbi:Urease accessory protein UreF 1 [Mesorhizobium plurifarium]|uniref:Urease accessory protein UreF n=1 Tax=Mesorhizobium plurifarium TaxID=69974 RepID=A0A090E5N7_MESPL|nr:Urease accessory protein UreF 1 [Mesorhizobium plurifarium]